ncbi:glycosyltransferase family A protein [Pontibacter sp. H259]|uniref:glycosyltransferase family 2 protein n=1 Tax=Pontibacter sp. H259 TaxID=3133421 RepID=UPI0030BA7868
MKVSIIIPAYNSGETIAETLRNCFNQSWKNIEVIVVDDGSTDNTISVIKEFLPKGLILHQQEKAGACVARNRGIELATGKYIQFLDADDLISRDKIQNQIKLLTAGKKDALSSCVWGRFYKNLDDFRVEDSLINKSYTNPLQWLIDSWNGKGMGQTSIWLTPTSLIKKAGPWNEDLKINQDGEFFARVLLYASEIIYCSDAVVYYRSSNKSSISQAAFSEAKVESLYRSFFLYKQHVSLHLQNVQVRQALARNFAEVIYRFSDDFPEICASAWGQIKELKPSSLHSVGGTYFRTLSGMIGFKKAVALRNFTSKVIKNFNG